MPIRSGCPPNEAECWFGAARMEVAIVPAPLTLNEARRTISRYRRCARTRSSDRRCDHQRPHPDGAAPAGRGGRQRSARRRSSSRPAASWRGSRRRCSCAISQPCTTSPANAPRPSYSRCRWTSSAILTNARARRANRAAGATPVRARRAPSPGPTGRCRSRSGRRAVGGPRRVDRVRQGGERHRARRRAAEERHPERVEIAVAP